MFSRFQMDTSAPSRSLLAMLTSATLLAAVAFSAPEARANDLIVKYDQSQILRLPRPVAEIIIGNPSIADITVQSKDMLVITGKSFGITNIIVLDADKNIIQDQRIIVQRDQTKIVNVHKRADRQSFNCSTQCNPTITVGDDDAYLKRVATSSQLKMKMSEGQAGGGGGGER